MYALTMPTNIAVMARSPKPGFFSVSGAAFRSPPPSFFRYRLPNSVARIMPHMMHTLISSAIVENACAVIVSPDSVSPSCSAAAEATWVS